MRTQQAVSQRARHLPLLGPVVVGLLLVGIPGLFSIFAEEASGKLALRLVIALVWVAVAIGAITATAKRDNRMEGLARQLTQETLVRRRQLRRSAFADAMQALTRAEWADLRGWELTVYMYDRDTNLLTPVFPAWQGEGPDLRLFESGRGATGMAWSRDEPVLVTGDAVSNAEFRLTPEQQAHWRGYRRVAAHPLRKDSAEKFGVLTALSREDDDVFASPRGLALLAKLADTFAVVLLAIRPTDEPLRHLVPAVGKPIQPTVLVDEAGVKITAYADSLQEREARIAAASELAARQSSFTAEQERTLAELRRDYQADPSQ